jgi:exopolysaccharide biosynthesis WecB/TagA/CpsF family protein
VVGCRDGYLNERSSKEAIERIVGSGADILFVCMGVPGQELWIHRHRAELKGVKLALGLGAFFDFYAEVVPRSPLWMRKARIEWVFRLIQEPRRLWKRYILGNIVFLWHVVACKFASIIRMNTRRY